MTIRAKLFLYMLVPLTAVLSVLTGVFYFRTNAQLQNSTRPLLLAHAEAMSQQINNSARVAQEMLELLLINGNITEYFTYSELGLLDRAEDARSKIEDDFFRAALRADEYVTVRLSDLDGHSIVDIVDQKIAYQHFHLSEAPWFQDTIRSADKNILIQYSVCGEHQDPGRSISKLYYDEVGRKRGLGSLHVHVKNFFEKVFEEQIGKNGYAYVIDPTGIVVAHKEKSKIGLHVSDLRSTVAVLSGTSGTVTEIDETNRTLMKKAYVPLDINGLGLVVAQPMSEIYALGDELRIFSLVTFFAILFLAAVFSHAMARRLARPIVKIRTAAKQVGQGDWDLKLDVTSNDEIGQLASSFNAMTSELKRNATTIQKLNDEIVERQRAEEELRMSRHYSHRIVNAMEEGLIVIDRDFIIRDANEPFLMQYQSIRENVIGRPCYEVTHGAEKPCSVSCHSCPAQEVRDSGSVVRAEHVHHDSTGNEMAIQLHAFPLFGKDGEVEHVVELSQNVTERKRAQDAVRESKERLTAIVESIQAGIILIDVETHRIVDANRFAINMIDVPKDRLLGSVCHKIVCPAETGRCPITDLGQEISNSECRLLTARGEEVPILKTIGRIMLGKKEHLLETFIDITEKKKLEKQLRQVSKMEAIGTLAGGIAHDFNNILTPILLNTEMALLELSETSTMRPELEEVLKAGNRAKNLVKQMLAFSRQGEQEISPVELSPIVKEALMMLRASMPTTIEIRQNINAGSHVVHADSTQIHQILMNLCTNAAHAMAGREGVLEVSLENVDLDADAAGRYPKLKPGPYVKLTVSDTGHGMDHSIMERIFDPFFTTKPKNKGTGMGLAVVHGIVKGYRGETTVESKPGRGTTFQVMLPRRQREGPDVSEFSPPTFRGKESILLVDDEAVVLKSVQRMLQGLGYEVVSTTESSEALELFRVQPERFDLVITDQTMPQMTGVALAKEILEIRPGIPIIICTGFSEAVSEEEAMTMGIKDYVMKPIVTQKISLSIRRLLDTAANKEELDHEKRGMPSQVIGEGMERASAEKPSNASSGVIETLWQTS